MKLKKKLFRTILQFLILILVAGYFTINAAEYTFANKLDSRPNVTVTINSDGSMEQDGTLFDGSLFPSSESDADNGIGSINGVIRLVNKYEKIDIENISIGLDSSKMEIRNDYPEKEVYNSFLDNVRLKVEKGWMVSFDKTLIGYTSLRNLLFDSDDGEYSGYNLADKNKFSLNKNDNIDLKYTLHMVEQAGNELQSVTAYIPIYINLQGNQITDDDDDNGGSHENEDNDSGDSEHGDNGVIIPPIDTPEIDDEDIDNEEIIIEVDIPVGQPLPEEETVAEEDEIVMEEEEIIIEDEEIPKGPPITRLPKTGSTSPLISVGLGTMLLGLGLFLRRKK